MRWALLICFALIGGPVFADDRAVEAAVHASFGDMPQVIRLDDISQVCGAKGQANLDVGFCTTGNKVYLREGAMFSAYKLAHVMGHAVQVRHGIADVALRAITQRRDEEAALRGLVTRQVECIAGFLMARAGLPEFDLRAAFEDEPFTGSHWGRNPLQIGPRVSIGLDARAEWFDTGYGAKTLQACAVGEMGAELLLAAYRG